MVKKLKEKSKDKFSVIIRTKNEENWIGHCIQSILDNLEKPEIIVIDNNGCSDTTFKQIWIEDEFWIYLPNSFTPDNNGINDYFCLSYKGIIKETFIFNIFNRGSDLVYSTNNIDDLKCMSSGNGWDGLHYKTGNKLPLGVYVFEIYFQDFEGWKHRKTGTISLIR